MIFALILLTIYLAIKKDKCRGEEIFLSAIVIWNIWSFFLVEFLSLINALVYKYVFAAWAIFIFILLFLIFSYLKKSKKKIKMCMVLKNLKEKICWFCREYSLIMVIGIIVFFLAMVTVPYNWDSMTYHLPRITHWSQNQSVAHYATNDIRQLSSPVLAEFINVQVYILSGKKDDLLNFLQTASYFIDAWLIYIIAAKIGCNKKFAYISTLLFMTMPIAFAEALNTQVDLFATLWMLIFVYYYLDVHKEKKIVANKKVFHKCCMMGACISLGYLAKPSVDVGMVAFLVFLLFKCIKRKDSWSELIKIVFVVLPIVFLPLLPEWIRNYCTFLSVAESSVGEKQLIGTLRLNYVFINMLKNLVTNMPNIYLYGSEKWMAKIVLLVATILHVDIDSASISENGMEYVLTEVPAYNHDSATSPIIIILAFMLFAWRLKSILKDKQQIGNIYSIQCMIIFLLFCSIVRWQPFVVRYLLAYQALLCPMIGYQVQAMLAGCEKDNIRNAVVPIIYFLCITELISMTRFHQERWSKEASSRPIGYFAKNKGIRPEYDEVFEWLNENGYHTLGIKVGVMNYEYPMWKMLNGSDIRIESVLVENSSRRYENILYIPDCIILDMRLAEEEIVVHGQLYKMVPEFGDNEHLAVYVKG